MEKSCPGYKGHSPTRATVSYIHLQNVANRFHKKQSVDSATRVTRLDRSPFFDCRVTLLAGPTFLHMNTLARPAGSTWSKRDNQSIRDRCFRQSEDARTLLARAKGSTLFSYHCTLMEERPFSQGQLFLT